jgi:AcrR family transcriptional regulator
MTVKTKAKTPPSNPRDRIMETAVRLFFEQGYMATGINQVIDEAEVCKATFYANFPSKEDLCLEYITTSHERWMELLAAQIGRQKRPFDRLLAVFSFLEDWMKGCSYRGCGLMNVASEIPDLKSRLRDKVQERNQLLKDTIRGLVKDLKNSEKKYAALPVDQMSDYLFLIVQGAVVSSQGSADLKPIQAARKSFESLLAASL